MSSSAPPLVIPLFITHQGCPHRCVFCNQKPITGTPEESTASSSTESIRQEILTWIKRSPRQGRRVEVAFYGGSFTGLPRERQGELLDAVQPFLQSGQVDTIRLSTRPDYIDQETPRFLREFGVSTVELGVQSLQQKVLDQSRRGHTVSQIEEAIRLLKAAGLRTGAQLMIGLPGETTADAIAGTWRLARLQPDFARLYPALVLQGSALETVYRQGLYQPLSLFKAVALASRLTAILAAHGIPVVRTGLQPSRELEASLVTGPYHPAFGELVKARMFFREVRRQLSQYRGRPCRLMLAEQDHSLFSGQKRCSTNRLRELGLLDQTSVQFEGQWPRGKVLAEAISPSL